MGASQSTRRLGSSKVGDREERRAGWTKRRGPDRRRAGSVQGELPAAQGRKAPWDRTVGIATQEEGTIACRVRASRARRTPALLSLGLHGDPVFARGAPRLPADRRRGERHALPAPGVAPSSRSAVAVCTGAAGDRPSLVFRLREPSEEQPRSGSSCRRRAARAASRRAKDLS